MVAYEPNDVGGSPVRISFAFAASVPCCWLRNLQKPKILWMASQSKVVLCSHGAGVCDGGTGGRLVGSWWRSERFCGLIFDGGGDGWVIVFTSSTESAVVLCLGAGMGEPRTAGTTGMGVSVSEASAGIM